jgi:hypothetical protein
MAQRKMDKVPQPRPGKGLRIKKSEIGADGDPGGD